MNLINVLGALVNLDGITNHSNKSSQVLKDVFHSSPSLIRIWWYPLLKSILENIFAPDKWSSISSRQGIGNMYLCIARLSTQIRQVPSFFHFFVCKQCRYYTWAHALSDHFFVNNSVTCLFSSSYSNGLIR